MRTLALLAFLALSCATPTPGDAGQGDGGGADADAASSAMSDGSDASVGADGDGGECFSGTCADDCRRRGVPTGGVCEGARCVCDPLRDAAADTSSDACEFRTIYTDDDGDGIGAGGALRIGCSEPLPPRASLRGDDCDDRNRMIYPGAPERCDGIDSNCDMIADRNPAPRTPPEFPRDATHIACEETGQRLGLWPTGWVERPRCAYRGLESIAPFRPVGSTVCQVCRSDSCACWTDPIGGGGMSVPCPPG